MHLGRGWTLTQPPCIPIQLSFFWFIHYILFPTPISESGISPPPFLVIIGSWVLVLLGWQISEGFYVLHKNPSTRCYFNKLLERNELLRLEEKPRQWGDLYEIALAALQRRGQGLLCAYGGLNAVCRTPGRNKNTMGKGGCLWSPAMGEGQLWSSLAWQLAAWPMLALCSVGPNPAYAGAAAIQPWGRGTNILGNEGKGWHAVKGT